MIEATKTGGLRMRSAEQQTDILTLRAADRAQWLTTFLDLPDMDVYYHPGYTEVLEINGDGIAHCLRISVPGAVLLYPFLLRPIPRALLKRASLSADYTDVITPYGYGGPALVAESPESRDQALQLCRETLSGEFARRRVVSEFIRFHPIFRNHKLCEAGRVLECRGQTAAFDLECDEPTLWSNVPSATRYSIRRALRAGVVIEEDEELHHLESFYRLYLATIQHHGAAAAYHYPLSFFIDTVEKLSGYVRLFFARHEGRDVAAALILKSGPPRSLPFRELRSQVPCVWQQ